MFPNLHSLDLSTNQIRQIEQRAFFGFKLLKALYLERNQISSISKDALDNLMNLTYLNLDYNQLEVLDFRWFRNMKSLKYLNIQYNKIERVKSWEHPWPYSLKKVSLKSNRIPVMPPIPKHAKMFNLEGNPIYCGCRPESLDLNKISNFTLCEVKMQCYSSKLKGNCKDKQVTEQVFKFWKTLSDKPVCEAPAIKELSYFRNQEGLFHLTCVATGIPAPNIALYSSDTEQKIQVYGIKNTNYTSATVNQLYSGRYYCKASNIVAGVTRKLVVDLNSLEISDDCNSTYLMLNSTSELPILHKRKESKSKYIIYTDSSEQL